MNGIAPRKTLVTITSVKINMTAEDWELYTLVPGAKSAAQKLNRTFTACVRKGMDSILSVSHRVSTRGKMKNYYWYSNTQAKIIKSDRQYGCDHPMGYKNPMYIMGNMPPFNGIQHEYTEVTGTLKPFGIFDDYHLVAIVEF